VSRPTHFATLLASEQADKLGFTLRQWQRLPMYVKDEILFLFRQKEKAQAVAEQMLKQQERSGMYQRGPKGERIYLIDDAITLTDGDDNVLRLVWNEDTLTLEVTGVGINMTGGLCVKPRVSNVVEITKATNGC